MVEDRLDEVLKQYDFEVYNRYRARGAVLLETSKGYGCVKNVYGSIPRLTFESKVLRFLRGNGYPNVDYILENKEGNIVSMDSAHNAYVVKNWFKGEECNLRDIDCVSKAAQNLATIHKILKRVPDAREAVGNENPDNAQLAKVFEKHNRELRRVRSYIRDKKCKNEFEICILNTFQEFYNQAAKAVEELEGSDYQSMYEEAIGMGMVTHGNYTYHNVFVTKDGLATTNFEKCSVGLQVFDLYFYFRKTMEKNDWDSKFGEILLETYHKENPMTRNERKLFHILTVYPEKYWKIVNFYFNNKKSWVSQRNTQKLIGIKEQQKKKEEFMKRLEKNW